MALRQVNWKEFLSPDSEISKDVFFLVEGEDGKISKIGAHRVLLAGISPVFKRMFFGPMMETKEEMEVKDTSPEAFKAMINYIYAQRSIYHTRCPKSKKLGPKTLFELFALGDRYDILNLKNKILDSLCEFEINLENLIYTATVANSYRELFSDLSTKLMMLCLKFYLELDTKDSLSLSHTFPQTSDDILHQLMEVGKSTLQLSGKSKRCFWRTLAVFFFRLGQPSLL